MVERIKESIEIKSAPEKVFQYLKLVKPRLRLNPAYKLIEFEKLTEGPITKGSRYRVKAIAGDRIIEYESEVVEFIENEKFSTCDTRGRLKVSLTLKPTKEGTLLVHEEEFTLSEEMLYPEGQEPEPPLWQKIIKLIIDVETAQIGERQRRIQELLLNLRQNLRVWLKRIKEEIETYSEIAER